MDKITTTENYLCHSRENGNPVSLLRNETLHPALNLARLITQEIYLMIDQRNPRHTFERQSKLLRDAFIEKES